MDADSAGMFQNPEATRISHLVTYFIIFIYDNRKSIFEIPCPPGFQDRSQDRFIRHRRGTSTHTRAAAAGSCELMKFIFR